MDYETLINLKFKRTEGSVDLTKSKWSSVVINEANNREESIDYSSAGRFDNGEAAHFDGEFSVINKLTGQNLELDLNTDEFTFALWMNCDFSKMKMKQYLLCGNNQDKSSKNSIYIQPNNDTFYMVIVSTTGTKISIPFLSNFVEDYSGEWVWLRLTKSKKNKCISLWVNETNVNPGLGGNINSSFKLVFNNSETCIGKGYDADYIYYHHLKGYIDDVVMLKGLAYEEFKVPTTYLLNELDPSLLEDNNNVWDEKEKEYSQYDSITDVIEWKRFNTKEEIDERESALIPYLMNPIYEQIDMDLPTWIKPVLTNPYRINDKVIYNINHIYNNTIDFNINYPDSNNGWELINDDLSSIKEWKTPNKYYNYMDKVLYNKRVYQSQINYNTELPAAWMVLTALTNTEKEELDDKKYQWDKEKEYSFKDRVKYGNKYYISIIDENTGYIPGDTSYWKEVGGNTSFITEWVKPTSYNKGDIVLYNGRYYHCNINYNILTPGNHHVEWTEITTWDQPKYKNAYHDGDKVFYKGKTYICDLAKYENGTYKYSNYSVVEPDKYVNKKYYKALAQMIPSNGNYYDPRNESSIFWGEIYKEDITDFSKFSEWVRGNIYNTGDLVVATDYDWKETFISEGYFQNKAFTIDRDDSTIKIKLYDAWDNHYLSNDKDKIYFKKNYLEAFNLNEVNGYILMLNDRFIKWDNIEIIRSDRFVTLSIKKPSSFVIKNLLLIKLPNKVVYSETGYMPDNGIKLFGFNNDGTFGNEINIYAINNRIRELIYTSNKFDNFFIDTNLEYKITKSNLFLFNEDGKFINRDNYSITSANIFTYIPIDGKKYTLYCIWDETENPNEDNLALIPNDTRVRQYLKNLNTNTNMDNDYPVDLVQLSKEFDSKVVHHTIDADYDSNIETSMNGIFNYNKNKFDSVYEEVRPVNITEYSESYMNSLKRNIRIKIDSSNINELLHSYIVEGTNLIELCDANKNKYMSKTVIMKLRQYLDITLTDKNINSYVGKAIIDGSDTVIITDNNKNNLIGRKVKFNTSSLFNDNTINDYDTIIMSRDIYNKYDYKNNTHVILFKRGMLPEWYNQIQYTNDKFYFSNIPRASSKTIYIEEYPKQYIQVTGLEGEFYNGKTTRSFEVEDGTDFESNYPLSVISDYGYTAGKIKESPGIVTSDSWIKAYEPEINFYTVTVITSPHQHIKVNILSNNEGYDLSTLEKLSYTDTTFKVPYNTTIYAEIFSDKGYTAGVLNYESATVTKDITIKAIREADANDCAISMANLYKEIIDMNIEYKGKIYRDTTINAKYGDVFKINTTIKNDRYKFNGIKYNEDTISKNDDGTYTLLDNTLISVNEPLENAHRLFIYDETNDMVVSAKNYGINNKLVSSCNQNEDMKIINRDIVKINVKPKSSYNAASPLIIDGTPRAITVSPSSTVNQAELNYTITAGETDLIANISTTKIRYFTINIPNKANQTVTVKYTNPIDGKTYTTTKSVSVPYGTTYSVIVTPNQGYNAGIANPSSGTVVNNVNINVSEAAKIKFKVTLNPGNGQTIIMNPALNNDGTYDWGTKWTATLVAWNGFRAGSIIGPTSGTIYSDLTINANHAAITDSLVTVLLYKHDIDGFAGQVGGQGNTTAAYEAAQKLLDNYPANSNNWVKAINGQWLGRGQSYGRTRYQAAIVKTIIEHPSITLDVKFVTNWTSNANITSPGTRTITNWYKTVVFAAHGGDKGHYGDGYLSVTVSVPGLTSWTFRTSFWTNTD